MADLVKEVQEGLVDLFRDNASDGGASDRDRPYEYLEKAAVLQEARVFHDSTAVREDPRRCCTVIGQLLRLRDVCRDFNETEATEVFFGVTKLFVSDDASLRRMVYLFIKDIYTKVDPGDVIIVTSSLTKDMTCDIDLYRANSLRVLCRIIDSSMLGAIERYVKQALVDSSGMVASSALVSASHLFKSSPECASIVRRWVGETAEAIKSPNQMVQFHAMLLMYQIKSHDRLGVSKIVQQYGQTAKARSKLKSPLAIVCLLRYTAKLMRDEVAEGRTADGSIQNASPTCSAGYQFLESSLRHKSELVSYEAARLMCGLPQAEPQDLSPAVAALQTMLSSAKPAQRFASVRALSSLAATHPRSVAKCNEDLEALIADGNRSIATLAITTLLKTGSENSIDRLLKHISTFLTDISDEYKITVVRSLQRLCLTYPSKHRVIVSFLANFLREEGGFEFKRSIVNGIVSLMRQAPETTDSTLMHLCEFIEDSEYAALSTQVLNLLGEAGPASAAPARYIRFIYNRVILENSVIRAAAVSALTNFAARCPSLRGSVVPLLRRSLRDEDDETRDRAALAVRTLEGAMERCPYVPPPEDAEADDVPPDVPDEGDPAAYAFSGTMPLSFDALERSLRALASTPGAMEADGPLTFESLPVVEDLTECPVGAEATAEGAEGTAAADMEAHATVPLEETKRKERADPAAAVYAVPELASMGRIFRSSKPVPLTESETEYVVLCVKHIYDDECVVLQFTVENTIEDQKLDDVTVTVETDSTLYEVTGEVAAENVAFGTTGSCFTVLQRNTGMPLETAAFTCELRFKVVQIDPDTGDEVGSASMEEEYPLEDLEITTSDFMAKVTVPDFRKAWEGVGDEHEVLEKFALQFKGQEDAVRAVIEYLGMQPCDGTATVKPNAGGKPKPHMLHLSGLFVGGRSVLARAQVAAQGESGGVVLKIAVRSEDEGVSRMVADCIR